MPATPVEARWIIKRCSADPTSGSLREADLTSRSLRKADLTSRSLQVDATSASLRGGPFIFILERANRNSPFC